VSRENVELIRSLLPGPEVDLVALFDEDSASGVLMQTLAPLLDPDFVSVAHFPGAGHHVRITRLACPLA
jgi:hypothetical protein